MLGEVKVGQTPPVPQIVRTVSWGHIHVIAVVIHRQVAEVVVARILLVERGDGDEARKGREGNDEGKHGMAQRGSIKRAMA